MPEEKITISMRTVQPTKMYGTAIVAICFTSYDLPTLGEKTWAQRL